MKTFVIGVMLALVTLCGFVEAVAQDRAITTPSRVEPKEVPVHLRPSDYAVQRAKDMGGEVFKLLDYANIRDPSLVNPSYHPFNAYYSFKERSHLPDQILLLRGELKTGGPWNYGFFADLDERDLRSVDIQSPETAYFLNYKVPALDSEIRGEINRLKDVEINGLSLKRSVKFQLGHTYLLRAISFDGFVRSYEPDGHDIFVALHVLESSPGESVTIVWKKLATFIPQVRDIPALPREQKGGSDEKSYLSPYLWATSDLNGFAN